MVTAAGGDAVRTLRWGLARYKGVLIACVLLVIIVLPGLDLLAPRAYKAEALVVAERLKISLVALPRYGQAVFNNGEVARRVAEEFGTDGDPEDVVPLRVSVDTPQDSVVFHVLGHAPDPERAKSIADLAAAVFTAELNESGPGVGSFAVQAPATAPTEAEERLRSLPYQMALGLLAGLALGLAVVSTILVIRQPIVSLTDAEEISGVSALGTAFMPRRLAGGRSREVAGTAGLVPLCRQLVSLRAETLLVVGPPSHRSETQKIIAALSAVLNQLPLPAGVGAGRSQGGSRPLLVDDVYYPDWASDPTATGTVLVVFEGSSAAALRAALTDYATAFLAGLIFVRTSGSRGEISQMGSPAPSVYAATARSRTRP